MPEQAETDLLRDRIDQLLLVQKAKELDIKVDQELSKHMAQLQLKSGITDPTSSSSGCASRAACPSRITSSR